MFHFGIVFVVFEEHIARQWLFYVHPPLVRDAYVWVNFKPIYELEKVNMSNER